VLNAADRMQWRGDATPTTTATVAAHMILPNYVASLIAPLDGYAVIVEGYAGSSRVEAVRPGSRWSTYLLAQP
jgi:hypothetical protein